MKSKTRTLSIILLILMLIFTSTACQRMSQVNKDITEEDENVTDSNSQNNNTGETKQKEEGSSYLIPTARNNGFSLLYGYADENGKIVIEPQFKFAEPFYACGAAIVTDLTGKIGIIDKKGNYLVQPQYNYFFYSEGLFLAYDYESNTSFAFDEKGNKTFEVTGYIHEFSNGLSPSYNETEKGYVDKSGKLALAVNYKNLGRFSGGIAKVSEEFLGPSFYIDTQGTDVTDKVSSGLRMYKDEANERYGYKNSSGEVVIEARFSEAEPFLDGHAIVSGGDSDANSLYGVINTAGEYVLEPKYCGIQRMENGLIAVGEALDSDYTVFEYFYYSKKALFTPDLKEHTDWIYYSAEDFDEKTVCVNNEDSIFFIGKDLKQDVSLPGFKGQGSLKKDGELLRGYVNDLLTVADKEGHILTGTNEKIDLGDGITAERKMESPERTTHLAYPLISGIKDTSVQDVINSVIFQELVTPYSQPVTIDDDPYSLTVTGSDYVIMRQKDLLLIDLGIDLYTLGAAHGGHYRNTLHMDIKTGAKFELTDLFKSSEEALSYLSEAVSKQMKEKMDEVGYWEDHVTITADTCFVLVEGGLVLYFGEYELASYAAGMQEFLVPFSEIMNYIDTEGDFWKSFN